MDPLVEPHIFWECAPSKETKMSSYREEVLGPLGGKQEWACIAYVVGKYCSIHAVVHWIPCAY